MGFLLQINLDLKIDLDWLMDSYNIMLCGTF